MPRAFDLLSSRRQNFTWKNIQTTGEERLCNPSFSFKQNKTLKYAILTFFRVQVPTPPQEDLYRGRQEAARVRVQGADEEPARGDAAAVVPGRGRGPQPRLRPALPQQLPGLPAHAQPQSSAAPQISRYG